MDDLAISIKVQRETALPEFWALVGKERSVNFWSTIIIRYNRIPMTVLTPTEDLEREGGGGGGSSNNMQRGEDKQL